MIYDNIDREIIHLLQGDIPLEPHPFRNLADSLNISEEEFLSRMIDLRQQGIIKRCAAILRHQQAGYISNAMVVWKVEEGNAKTAGEIMAQIREVSHCYLREVDKDFAYPLFTMVHAQNDEQLSQLVEKIALQTGIKEYKIIKSKKELKKCSMKYIK